MLRDDTCVFFALGKCKGRYFDVEQDIEDDVNAEILEKAPYHMKIDL